MLQISKKKYFKKSQKILKIGVDTIFLKLRSLKTPIIGEHSSFLNFKLIF